MWEQKNATLFLVLATTATIMRTGVTPVAARYCLQGDAYAGAGDCGFVSYQQCQATASGRMAYCVANPYLANAAVITRLRAQCAAVKCESDKVIAAKYDGWPKWRADGAAVRDHAS